MMTDETGEAKSQESNDPGRLTTWVGDRRWFGGP
jgi:hypothetical protein